MLQNVLSRNVEESFKRVLDPDPEAEEFQKFDQFFPGLAPTCVKFDEDCCYRTVTVECEQKNTHTNGADQHASQNCHFMKFRLACSKLAKVRKN